MYGRDDKWDFSDGGELVTSLPVFGEGNIYAPGATDPFEAIPLDDYVQKNHVHGILFNGWSIRRFR